MNYSYEFTASFKRKLKQLLKKYKSLKNDILNLQQEIKANPDLGVDLGSGFRKIRLKITSKNTKIIFVYLWDKSEMESVDISVLRSMIEQ